VESREPKKFSAMFLKDFLCYSSVLDHLLGIITFEACKLYNRHVYLEDDFEDAMRRSAYRA